MQKSLPAWAYGVLGTVGAVLVGSMILNWIDFGGAFTVRGYTLALEQNHWLLLVPVAGLLLVGAAATRSAHTRLAAIFAGVVVTGYVLFGLTRGILTAGLETWLMLGGAGAMLAGAKDRTWLRAAGGAAVLAGFFAPWADLTLAGALWRGYASGLAFKVLWLVPVAGVVGILSAGNRATGRQLAAGAGITVYGTFLVAIGATAMLVFGLGAWIAVGASTVALVIGVLARGPEAATKQLAA